MCAQWPFHDRSGQNTWEELQGPVFGGRREMETMKKMPEAQCAGTLLTCLMYMLFPEELGPVMTLTLPLSPPHSAELGTKVRAQSSIRGCLPWVESHLTCGLSMQTNEATRRWGLWAP